MTARSLIERLAAAVGSQGLITDPREAEPYVKDWRGLYHGATPAVVRPATTAQVVEVVSAPQQKVAGGLEIAHLRRGQHGLAEEPGEAEELVRLVRKFNKGVEALRGQSWPRP